MNQRLRKSLEKRRTQNDISGATINTGGLIARHDRGKDPEVRVPQKVTGELPAEKAAGLAKASPLFKELKDVVVPESKADEAKAVAEATTETVKKTEAEQPAPAKVVKKRAAKKTTEDNAE